METRPHPARGKGRPRTSPVDRAEQLRRAKRAQRERQRARGVVPFQWDLPEDVAARLQAARGTEDFERAFLQLLDDALVDLHAWPTLHELAWNRKDRWIPAREALALYERNWRFVERDRLQPDEAGLIERLQRRFGGGASNA